MIREKVQRNYAEPMHDISRQTFYKWRSKYVVMESKDLKSLE